MSLCTSTPKEKAASAQLLQMNSTKCKIDMHNQDKSSSTLNSLLRKSRGEQFQHCWFLPGNMADKRITPQQLREAITADPGAFPVLLTAVLSREDKFIKTALALQPLLDEKTFGYTALHVAICNQDSRTIQRLAAAGADVTVSDPSGSSYVKFAVTMGFQQAIRILHRHGAPLDSVDEEGRSALMAAAYLGDEIAVESLLSLGANCHVKDSNGDGAMSLAILNDKYEIAKFIYSRCTRCYQDMAAVMNISQAEFDDLVDKNPLARSVALYRIPQDDKMRLLAGEDPKDFQRACTSSDTCSSSISAQVFKPVD